MENEHRLHSLNSNNDEHTYSQYAEDNQGDTLPFYKTEGQLLALWDQLNELKLEIALLETPIADVPSTSLDSDVRMWLN